MSVPIITYNYVKINGVDITMGGTGAVSFVSPYNSVNVQFIAINTSLSRFVVRVTKYGEEYGLNIGTCPINLVSIPKNVTQNISIPVNATYFTQGDTGYRVSLYAQSATDGKWDCTELFMSLNGLSHDTFIPLGSDGMEVVVQTSTS